jgi:pimeloyl-ACP methyl ester carboxylesterase
MIDRAELEYEVAGSGEALLLISTGPIADSFLPFLSSSKLATRYQMVRYRQRQIDPGQPRSVSFHRHAEDAAALLRHLGITSAHAAGHSTGACIGLQLALDRPKMVRSLILLEPLFTVAASAGAFFEKVGPALSAYRNGQPEEAMRQFLSVVSGLEWQECRSVIDGCVPGGADTAIKNADNFFGSYLPALSEWRFGPDEAARVKLPVLSVIGSETEPLFADGHELLRAWLPQLQVCRVDGAAHLLHLQQPDQVIRGIEDFLARHVQVMADQG